jgi:DNA uptake protein ComE-like DNA-binding protein
MNELKPGFWLTLAVATLSLSIAGALSAQVGRHQGMTEPNVVDEKELVKLPHLNPGLVKGILERRPFTTMMDLHKFLSPSLDSKQLNELYTKMFVQINLNTSPRDEIMLIPGMGNRMVREFLEYRPYTALTQFRKEIGKYVDDKEVARLEQYVFVPINLNTASDENLSSIPGASPQLIRTIKDSRPYKDMEQFRREIAKSVSAKEATRLERYFVIN